MCKIIYMAPNKSKYFTFTWCLPERVNIFIYMITSPKWLQYAIFTMPNQKWQKFSNPKLKQYEKAIIYLNNTAEVKKLGRKKKEVAA